MGLELSGRSALLIGAGRGIGAAAALAMSREGCKVALVARSADALAARVAECRAAGSPDAHAIVADAIDPKQLASAVESAARGCTPPRWQSHRGPHPLTARLLAGPPRGGRSAT